jgi:outer membrane protein OmpA-like peptidoglycan-associated protein
VKNIFFLLLFFISFASTINAQDTLRTRYGVMGGLNANMYSADFRAIPGVPNCCPLFTSGSGSGVAAALFYDIPFTTDFFYGLRLNYMDHSAELSAIEGTTVIVGGVAQAGSFTHTIDASITSFGLEPEIGVKFWKFVGSIGLRIGFPITKVFGQQEVTSVGTFTDSLGNDTHKSIRDSITGKLPNPTPVLLHGVASIGFELPLNPSHTTFLVPEISYSLAFNDAIKGLTWKMNALTFGISMKFSPKPEVPKPHVFDTVIVRDTATKFVQLLTTPRITLSDTRYEHSTKETDVITELTTIHQTYLHEMADPHMLQASVSAVGLDDEGNETPMATLEIEEFLQLHAHPLLGYIFFGNNESNLPLRYTQISGEQAGRYKPNDLFGLDDIEVHHNVLNIVGKRLQEYSNAKITLIGCNNDVGDEKANMNLSKSRAETVRNYLINIWNIDPSRIKTEARGLPETPSTSKSEDGQAENRRVEISSDNPQVTDVFTASDTTRVAAPPQLRFKTTANSASPMTSWVLTASQRGKAIKTFSDKAPVPASIDWDIANDQKNVPRFNEPLELKLSIKNSLGDEKVVTTSLPTQVRTIEQKRIEHASDTTIDKYNLVLFNFGKSDMTPAHERILSAVKSRLKPTSQILIEGYTDRTGTSASNQKLATSRAKSTADALGRKDARVFGIGDKRLLYPNDTPEGRFFCRTVQITAKTPTN